MQTPPSRRKGSGELGVESSGLRWGISTHQWDRSSVTVTWHVGMQHHYTVIASIY
jgi:hypothetical protein